jgi:pyridoxal phosphate enzyme (YggS family)
MTATRRDELAANLEVVRTRIAQACRAAGRNPDEVSLLAVSKTFPVSDIAELVALGQRDLGESRHQEAFTKVQALGFSGEVRWHFLGRLQRNKAAAIASYADCVQSVDRMELVPVLSRGATVRGRPLDVLIQVNLDEQADPGFDGGRGGAATDEVLRLASLIATTQGLVLRGVMAVAPRDIDPRSAFADLRSVADQLRAEHPAATVISAGMSGDLEAAVLEGSTLVRVGTALFGRRMPALG